MFTFTYGQLTISVAVLIITVWAGVKYLTKVNVDHIFNKKLENHKSELQSLQEYNKFDLQRKMHDFSLYNSKKHAIYPNVYELFLNAQGRLNELRGGRRVPDYKNMSSIELRHTLKEIYELDNVYLDPIIASWETEDREHQYVELRKFIKRVEIVQARMSVTEARNQTLLQWLYFSENIAEELHQLSIYMLHYLVDIEFEDEMKGPDGVELRKAMSAKKEEIDRLLTKVRADLQAELKKGYYE
ncbi:hypothetical protein [Paenibacillus sp. JDR-2]|uniref:hypothetical protein n=1 Tax=Paenibacillus sp. (strain JDR-2) TaxID=324057 RepID=UPI000166A6A5|nr:hypothetical protein [Paenibacillus sp. JDR-2]ACT00207.1 hypothetical protein Pjdr2_1535 [Paenibacillus sp. JDR-2]